MAVGVNQQGGNGTALTKPIQGKSSRIAQMSWETLQSYIADGAILDLAEEIAELHTHEQEIRNDPDLPAGQKHYLLKAVRKDRIDAKQKYQKMKMEQGRFITEDAFYLFLDDLYAVLNVHVKDPSLLQQIGQGLSTAAERLRKRMGK